MRKITMNTTLKEVMENPCFAGWEYCINPWFSPILPPEMNVVEQPIGEFLKSLPDWQGDELIEGLEYLSERVQKGKVFYNIWDEQEKSRDASKGSTALMAFPVEGNRKSKFVLIQPGGAYLSVCSLAEGFPIAKRLNEMGYSAFILQYRVAENAHFPNPLEDMARALQLIFSHGQDWNLDLSDYGILGFSAGGHLTAAFGTERLGYKKYGLPRPGMVILGYPVVTMGENTHKDSRKALLGDSDSDPEIQELYSVEKQVTDVYPKTFIWQCEEDASVPSVNSRELAAAIQKKGIPCKYEVFRGSAHGWGLGDKTAASGWLERAMKFWHEEKSGSDM